MNPADPRPEDSAPALLRHSAVMAVGTTLSRLTGFLRLTAMAWALGITETRIADAYNASNTTPNILYELVLGGILSSVFVPVFVEWLERRGREAAFDLGRRLLSVAVVVLSGVAVLGMVLAPWIMELYAAGIDDPSRHAYVVDLGTFFLRFFMPQIVFYGIGAVATGLLNAERRFAAPMFAPILNNLIVIATFLIYGAMAGADRADAAITVPEQLVLAIGTTLGVVGMTAALWPSLRRTGFRFHWRGHWADEGVRRLLHLAKWTVVYVVANQIGYMVILLLAFRDQGGYTAYGAAFILFQLPYAIFAVSIFTALLPALSSRWTAGDTDGFRSMLTEGIRMTGFIVIPAACAYLVLAEPIVRLLLEHGVAGRGSAELVSQVLVMFAVGLFSFAGFQLLLRAFYSMQDTKTPALINLVALAANVTANLLLVLVLDLGVRGLALGHAIGYTVALALALVVLRRRLGGLDARRTLRGLARIVVASLATAAVAWGVANLLEGDGGVALLLQVGAAVVMGLAVYLLAAYLLRMDELTAMTQALRRRGGR